MKIIIIGAGPGGMDAAIAARQQGYETILIEKAHVGGTCLNKGCIPTKALLHCASEIENANRLFSPTKSFISFEPHTRPQPNLSVVGEYKNSIVEQLRSGATMQLNGIELIEGEAEFTGPKTIQINGRDLTADKIIIATGSKPSRLNIPGAQHALTSDDVLQQIVGWNSSTSHIAIIGGGVIGIEFATIILSLFPGVELTVIEYCKEILPPFDKEIAKRLRMLLTKKGVKFITGASVTALPSSTCVEYKRNGENQQLQADKIIMATGRQPVFPSGIEKAGIEFTAKGIKTDAHFATTAPDVYAIGDVNGRCMLAHAASAQGRKVMGADVNTDVIPSVVFSTPECAMVGLTEEQCKQQEIPCLIKKAFFRANGKAVCMEQTDGLVKLLINPETNALLGVHIVGPHAADLIAEAADVMANNRPVTDIARTIHAHPTLNEIITTALNE